MGSRMNPRAGDRPSLQLKRHSPLLQGTVGKGQPAFREQALQTLEEEECSLQIYPQSAPVPPSLPFPTLPSKSFGPSFNAQNHYHLLWSHNPLFKCFRIPSLKEVGSICIPFPDHHVKALEAQTAPSLIPSTLEHC